jgi:hypothetical protein
MKTYVFILSCFFLLQSDNQIEKIKIFLYGEKGLEEAVPERYKPYLTQEQIKEFEYGLETLDKDAFKIYYITYYHDLAIDKIVMTSEGYHYLDAEVGIVKYYYPSGKIKEERNSAIVNIYTHKIISMEKFNRIKNKIKGTRGYVGEPHGTRKYYSEDGKLVKEEEYDKGTLVKTTNY